MLPHRATTVVVYIVTAGWTANLAASIMPWLDYTSDPLVHTAFMATVGVALGADAFARRRAANNQGDDKP